LVYTIAMALQLFKIFLQHNGSNFSRLKKIVGVFVFLFSFLFSNAQKKQPPPSPVALGSNNKLVYSADEQGNRIPDFSFAGYKAGGEAIPNVTIQITVPLTKGDATQKIQSAIDYVSSLPLDKNGFRGAVLLEKGQYEVQAGLYIKTSGVILRGSGMNKNGTTIIGAGKDRQTLITIKGKNDRTTETPIRIGDVYVPVNANQLHINNHSFKIGDDVIIHRPSTKKWIDVLGTAHFGGGLTALGWKPGERDVFWDRKIISIDQETITLDAPITTALDTTYGGGFISKCNWPGRIQQSGVENIRLVSTYDASNSKDEAHRWMAITLENIADAWVRQVSFEHFAGSAVAVLETAKKITVEDCKSLHPVSEIGGQRRYTFYTSGQQTLFQRCYAEYGYHDFAVDFCSSLNAFVQCESYLPFSFSGTIDSWASGILFDIVNVEGQALSFLNRSQDAQGAGWTAANSVLWQCAASRIDNYKPPTANNWAFGSWAEFSGDGYWESSNEHVNPRSLYYTQLSERIGNNALRRAFLLPVESEASSSPSVEVAAALTKQSLRPALLLKDWIDQAYKRNPIPINDSKHIQQSLSSNKAEKKLSITQIKNGWLVRDNEILFGRRAEQPWWRGNVHPDGIREANYAITRFVPGRIGKGLTDELNEMTDSLVESNRTVFEHNYGLWYDRRRDDHERIRRINGEVWPPFYELPFARSGRETAWDGLSKYDLTKYNYWYWNRLKNFADLADEKGLVLIHQNYFQHNIIEAGAHYADFPWRTANNINNTGFPEPVPYAGDKRLFMAEQFYDVTDPQRRSLHRAYIRQCMENFKNNNSVIQLISAEYTGPLHFVQYWLDVIKEWEKETGKKEIIGLSTTKDVQDAILADPARAVLVDLIDIRYWHYEADGKEYAPKGGQNLAPRQHARLLKPKKTSFEQVYRAVREYKQKYPSKAVTYSGDSYDQFGWAVLMAGGSLPVLPKSTSKEFLSSASTMMPVAFPNKISNQYALANHQGESIVYAASGFIELDLTKTTNSFLLRWMNPEDGREIGREEKITGGKKIEVKAPVARAVILWLSRL
jgi:hypothetical protein